MDSVLERNLTFVDTPGYSASPASSTLEEQNVVVDYVESLLHQNISPVSMEDSELLGVISGNGGTQVDVVFYLLSPSKLLKTYVSLNANIGQTPTCPRTLSSCNAFQALPTSSPS